MLKFLRFVLGTYLLVLVAGSLIWLVLWKTDSIKLYNIQTGSMAPLMQAGDLIFSAKTDSAQLRTGDIISYKSSQTPKAVVTHRIYKIYPTKGYVVSKGDNLAQPDPPVPYSSITGKTIKVIPNAGYIFNFLHQPAGLIGLIYLPALLICAYELQRIITLYSYKSYTATAHL